MTTFCIKGVRIIDPANDRDEIADLWISDGKIRTSAPEGEIETTIDASGQISPSAATPLKTPYMAPSGGVRPNRMRSKGPCLRAWARAS